MLKHAKPSEQRATPKSWTWLGGVGVGGKGITQEQDARKIRVSWNWTQMVFHRSVQDREDDGPEMGQRGVKRKEKNRNAARKSRRKQTERADELHEVWNILMCPFCAPLLQLFRLTVIVSLYQSQSLAGCVTVLCNLSTCQWPFLVNTLLSGRASTPSWVPSLLPLLFLPHPTPSHTHTPPASCL